VDKTYTWFPLLPQLSTTFFGTRGAAIKPEPVSWGEAEQALQQAGHAIHRLSFKTPALFACNRLRAAVALDNRRRIRLQVQK
jgi:hypothetical protein